jgi:hypothetical protein
MEELLDVIEQGNDTISESCCQACKPILQSVITKLTACQFKLDARKLESSRRFLLLLENILSQEFVLCVNLSKSFDSDAQSAEAVRDLELLEVYVGQLQAEIEFSKTVGRIDKKAGSGAAASPKPRPKAPTSDDSPPVTASAPTISKWADLGPLFESLDYAPVPPPGASQESESVSGNIEPEATEPEAAVPEAELHQPEAEPEVAVPEPHLVEPEVAELPEPYPAVPEMVEVPESHPLIPEVVEVPEPAAAATQSEAAMPEVVSRSYAEPPLFSNAPETVPHRDEAPSVHHILAHIANQKPSLRPPPISIQPRPISTPSSTVSSSSSSTSSSTSTSTSSSPSHALPRSLADILAISEPEVEVKAPVPVLDEPIIDCGAQTEDLAPLADSEVHTELSGDDGDVSRFVSAWLEQASLPLVSNQAYNLGVSIGVARNGSCQISASPSAGLAASAPGLDEPFPILISVSCDQATISPAFRYGNLPKSGPMDPVFFQIVPHSTSELQAVVTIYSALDLSVLEELSAQIACVGASAPVGGFRF